jgi:hypothetical protein
MMAYAANDRVKTTGDEEDGMGIMIVYFVFEV